MFEHPSWIQNMNVDRKIAAGHLGLVNTMVITFVFQSYTFYKGLFIQMLITGFVETGVLSVTNKKTKSHTADLQLKI